jgi:hypothetical protein
MFVSFAVMSLPKPQLLFQTVISKVGLGSDKKTSWQSVVWENHFDFSFENFVLLIVKSSFRIDALTIPVDPLASFNFPYRTWTFKVMSTNLSAGSMQGFLGGKKSLLVRKVGKAADNREVRSSHPAWDMVPHLTRNQMWFKNSNGKGKGSPNTKFGFQKCSTGSKSSEELFWLSKYSVWQIFPK